MIAHFPLQMHTAVKISPQYTGPVVYVLDASRSVPVVQSLLDAKNKVAFAEDIKEQYAEMREVNASRPTNLASPPSAHGASMTRGPRMS